jgi:RNA polymerase sigma-70 factor (ECF subfamily)
MLVFNEEVPELMGIQAETLTDWRRVWGPSAGASDCPDSEFTELVRLARDGDEDAWAALAAEYEPRLRKVAYALLGRNLQPEVDTADLVQLVHWSLWSGLRQGKYELAQPGCLYALALRILRNKVARLWLGLKRRKRLAARAVEAAGRKNHPDPACSGSCDPLCGVLAEDEFEHLSRSLTKIERRLIELRLEGYNTAEAARLLDHDPNSLRVVLKRLREKARSRGFHPDLRGPRPATRKVHLCAG